MKKSRFKKPRQKETGAGGLTDQVRKLLLWYQANEPGVWVQRNLSANVMGGRFVRTPNNEKGRPDFEFLYKGQFVALELKRDSKEDLSPEQLEQIKRIRAAGGLAYKITNLPEVVEVFKQLGCTRRVILPGQDYIPGVKDAGE